MKWINGSGSDGDRIAYRWSVKWAMYKGLYECNADVAIPHSSQGA